ncbi:MAG: selenocysteine-specific translation elongation factor [Pirellulaceae bacterium]|nr:selenocysteine-specific translation elongation factor [Pirellulaceae bacterium]
MTTDLILGTAGHIDHGKSSLIRALTGVDPDRLPEEKRRGITIELGFAELLLDDFRLGVVDVPGHERFVRNMLAGATGMDIALLVVAADDSVKPQTLEHLEILRLLDLNAGVIALTKSDLVDPDWAELVEEEIRALVAGSFLDRAPIVRTSTVTGAGLEELKSHLLEAAKSVAASGRLERERGPFRMAIDRTFSIAGHGTVVTGSVSSGRAAAGDELILEPGNLKARVRGIHNHDRSVDEIHRGQRAAINLGGVHHDQIRRGQELCSPGHLVPSRLITTELTLLETAPRPLKNRSRVRLHVGTAELLTTVRLLEADQLQPGQSGFAQLFLSEAAVTVWSQPLVIRSESPVITVGGGRVLDPDAQRIRKPNEETIRMLGHYRSDDPIERASAALYFAGLREWKPIDLARTAGIEAFETATDALRERGDLCEIRVSPTRNLHVHGLILKQLCKRIAVVLNQLHDEFPLRTVFDRSVVANRFRYLDESILQACLKLMVSEQRLKFGPTGISLVGRGPKLSQNEQKLLNELVDRFRAAGIQSPSIKECQKQTTKNQAAVGQLLALAAANGDLVALTNDVYLHAEVESGVRQQLRDALATNRNGLTLSEIREILETTRKYAVPLCEYLDRIGFTKRQGDVRVLAEARP